MNASPRDSSEPEPPPAGGRTATGDGPPAEGGPARRRRGGRPKSAAGEGLSVVVVTRLQEREAAQVRDEAAGAGMSVAAYVRRRLFNRPVEPRAVRRSLGAVQKELGRLGTNLNQLVRRAHEAAPHLDRGGAAAVAAAVEESRAVLTAIREAAERVGRGGPGAHVRGEADGDPAGRHRGAR